MTPVGGPKSLTDVINAAGGEVGPRTKWLGAWALKSGTGDWDGFFQGCKAEGATPLIYWWTWGDQISPAAIRDGVYDTYQKVTKTRANLLPLLNAVMQKAKAAGVEPIVTIENEFNKHGCQASPEFAAWFDASAAVIRSHVPAAKIVFSLGAWEADKMPAIVAFYAPQVAQSDMMGLQCGFFLPRSPKADLAKVGTGLSYAFQKLGTSKPRILYDVFLSTYGGAYEPSHPYPGGDGRALDLEQAKGLASLAAIPGLTSIVYRSLKDPATFDVANHGGFAERHVGLRRSDGTDKPGLAALIALSKPPLPLVYTEAQVSAVRDRLATSQAEIVRLTADANGLTNRIRLAKEALG